MPRPPVSPRPPPRSFTSVSFPTAAPVGVQQNLIWFALLRWLVMSSIFSCAHWPRKHLPWENGYSDPLPIRQIEVLVFFISRGYLLNVTLTRGLGSSYCVLRVAEFLGRKGWWISKSGPLCCRVRNLRLHAARRAHSHGSSARSAAELGRSVAKYKTETWAPRGLCLNRPLCRRE